MCSSFQLVETGNYINIYIIYVVGFQTGESHQQCLLVIASNYSDTSFSLYLVFTIDDPVLPSSSTEVDESISEQSITNTFPLPVPSMYLYTLCTNKFNFLNHSISITFKVHCG